MPQVLNMPVLRRVLSVHIPRVPNMLGLEYTRFVKMSTLHRVLCKIYFKGSRYLECLEFCFAPSRAVSKAWGGFFNSPEPSKQTTKSC